MNWQTAIVIFFGVIELSIIIFAGVVGYMYAR